MHENIGGKIRYQRKKAKLTQAKLGSLAFNVSESIGQTRIKNLELHYVKEIYNHEIKAICKILKISVKELISSPTVKISPKHPIDGLHIPQKILDDNPELDNYLNMCILAIQNDNWKLFLEIINNIKAFLEEKLNKQPLLGKIQSRY